MDLNNIALSSVMNSINRMIKRAVVEISTNANPENDEPKYTYNQLLRMRIKDLRDTKKVLTMDIKGKILNAGSLGLTKDQAKALSASIQSIFDDAKDVLDNQQINTP